MCVCLCLSRLSPALCANLCVIAASLLTVSRQGLRPASSSSRRHRLPAVWARGAERGAELSSTAAGPGSATDRSGASRRTVSAGADSQWRTAAERELSPAALYGERRTGRGHTGQRSHRGHTEVTQGQRSHRGHTGSEVTQRSHRARSTEVTQGHTGSEFTQRSHRVRRQRPNKVKQSQTHRHETQNTASRRLRRKDSLTAASTPPLLPDLSPHPS